MGNYRSKSIRDTQLTSSNEGKEQISPNTPPAREYDISRLTIGQRDHLKEITIRIVHIFSTTITAEQERLICMTLATELYPEKEEILSIPTKDLPPIKEKSTYKKKPIPDDIRLAVWRKRNGENLIGPCYCCNKSISYGKYQAGHIVAERNGGETVVENLEPVCKYCNTSMGTCNLNEYKDLLVAGTEKWRCPDCNKSYKIWNRAKHLTSKGHIKNAEKDKS